MSPIALYVLYLELSSGFHSATFTIHLSSGVDSILSTILHFILLCVLIQHQIFASSILSLASSVLLFMLHSSLLPQSQFRKIYRCPDRCVFELCPSSFSSSVLLTSLVSLFSLVSFFWFRDLFVSSICLYDEAKHFA